MILNQIESRSVQVCAWKGQSDSEYESISFAKYEMPEFNVQLKSVRNFDWIKIQHKLNSNVHSNFFLSRCYFVREFVCVCERFDKQTNISQNYGRQQN